MVVATAPSFATAPAAIAYRLTLETPVGWMTLEADEAAVTGLSWGLRANRPSPLLTRAAAQLADYFAGTLRAFDLPLAPAGSEREKLIWAELCRIPYGETITYGELARRVDSVPRAVGGSCGTNPIAIIIPCHRVTAAGGALGGYSGIGGTATKKRLLAHEARHSGIFALSP